MARLGVIQGHPKWYNCLAFQVV